MKDIELDDIFEELSETLSKVLPSSFEKAWIWLEFADGVVTHSNYFRDRNGVTYFLDRECNIAKPFHELWRRFKEAGRQPPSAGTFFIDRSGKFDLELGYSDIDLPISEAWSRREDWKRKHLGNAEIVTFR